MKVGTRNEAESIPGISHFIEHMLFKGTKKRSSKKISNDIDYYGGSINAHTTHDHTCFYVKLPYNHIDIGLEVLSDVLINSIFDEDSIEKEKSVVIEEIRMYEDSPEEYLYESLMGRTFSNKGIGRNILGSVESITSITRDDIVDFFYKHYIPENSVFICCGNFDFDEVYKKIEHNFSKWDNSRGCIQEREGQVFKENIFIEDRDDEQVSLAILTQCPDDSEAMDFYSVKLISNILGNTTSSRLFQNIREERGLCYSVYTDDNFYIDYGEFGIYAGFARENTVEVLDLIIDEILRLKKFYISEEELTFAKEKYKGSLLMSMEDTSDRMMSIGTYEVIDERMPDYDSVISVIDSIDIGYIKNVIDRMFNQISIGITGKNINEIINESMFERMWR